MGQRNEAEVGGDTRDINACRVNECNGNVSTAYRYASRRMRTGVHFRVS
jgi:hypothetical protein